MTPWRSPVCCLALAGLGMLAGAAPVGTVLKVGYATSKESHLGVGATVFCEEVQRRTQGRYACQHFPASALGGERTQVESVQAGTQDIVNTSTGPLGDVAPEVRVFDLPFLFRDAEHARKVMDSRIGQQALGALRSRGIVALGWTENGMRHLTNSRRPVVNVDDARGLRVRTMENRLHVDAFRAFGMLPTPLPFTELFGALKAGTLDGQENPIPVITASRFWEVQKYLSLTGHVYSPALLIVSPKVWERLSPPDRQVFEAAAHKAGQAQRRRVDEEEASGIALLRKQGMQVVDKVDSESFRRAVAPAYTDYAREFGADRIAAIQAVH